jgi:hypothetical protein
MIWSLELSGQEIVAPMWDDEAAVAVQVVHYLHIEIGFGVVG